MSRCGYITEMVAAKREDVLDDEEKRFVAYHESGHAVLQHLLGWDLLFVGIGCVVGRDEKWKGGSRGSNLARPEGAIIAYGGPLAEAKVRGISLSNEELIAGKMPAGMRDLGGWACDAERARQFAGVERTGEFATRARSLVHHPNVWRRISSLASELCGEGRLRKMTFGEVPDDVRCEILPGLSSAAFACAVEWSCLKGEETIRIINIALGSDFAE